MTTCLKPNDSCQSLLHHHRLDSTAVHRTNYLEKEQSNYSALDRNHR